MKLFEEHTFLIGVEIIISQMQKRVQKPVSSLCHLPQASRCVSNQLEMSQMSQKMLRAGWNYIFYRKCFFETCGPVVKQPITNHFLGVFTRLGKPDTCRFLVGTFSCLFLCCFSFRDKQLYMKLDFLTKLFSISLHIFKLEPGYQVDWWKAG